ncbi:hypothetical protein ACOME3_008859 [Neoechinorhynchus agilis]
MPVDDKRLDSEQRVKLFELTASVCEETQTLSRVYRMMFEIDCEPGGYSAVPQKFKDSLKLRLEGVKEEIVNADSNCGFALTRSLFVWLKESILRLLLFGEKSRLSPALSSLLDVDKYLEAIRQNSNDHKWTLLAMNKYSKACIDACQQLCCAARDELVQETRSIAADIDNDYEKDIINVDREIELITRIAVNIQLFQIDLIHFTVRAFRPLVLSAWPAYYRKHFDMVVQRSIPFDIDCFVGIRDWLTMTIDAIQKLSDLRIPECTAIVETMNVSASAAIKDIVIVGYVEFLNPMNGHVKSIFTKDSKVRSPLTLEVELNRFAPYSLVTQRVIICQAIFMLCTEFHVNPIDDVLCDQLYSISEAYPEESDYGKLIDNLNAHVALRLKTRSDVTNAIERELGLHQGEPLPEYGLPIKPVLSVSWLRTRRILIEYITNHFKPEAPKTIQGHHDRFDKHLNGFLENLSQLLLLNYEAFADIYEREINQVLSR